MRTPTIRTSMLGLAAAALFVFAVAPLPASAQEEGAARAPTAQEAAPAAQAEGAAAQDRPTPPAGFERVTGAAAVQPNVAAPPLVVAAYLFIWGVILVYLVVLWQRQRRLNAELEGLARRLRRAVE